MQVFHGTYTGTLPLLHGKAALLMEGGEGRYLAQFDDFALAPYCYGWHDFPAVEFKPDAPVRWDDNIQEN